jgi:hypothetical protein
MNDAVETVRQLVAMETDITDDSNINSDRVAELEGNLFHVQKGVSVLPRKLDIEDMIKERISNLQWLKSNCGNLLPDIPRPNQCKCCTTTFNATSPNDSTINSAVLNIMTPNVDVLNASTPSATSLNSTMSTTNVSSSITTNATISNTYHSTSQQFESGFRRCSYLYTLQRVYPVKVHYWSCVNRNKNCEIGYDGNKDGIFNFNNLILVSHAVLMDFLIIMVCSKSISFNGFVDKMNMQYELLWPPNKENGVSCYRFMHVKQWIQCFLAWTDLLQIGGSQMPFLCTLCGVYPSWLCFDGVSLAIRKQQISWNTIDQIPNIKAPIKPKPISNTQALIEDVLIRKLLKLFISTNCTDSEFQELLQKTEQPYPVLNKLLTSLYNRELAKSGIKQKVYSFGFVGVWKPLLQIWASRDNIQFFLHPYVVCVMKSILTNNIVTASMSHLLNRLCPIMHKLFTSLSENGQLNIPDFGKAVLEYFVDTCISFHPTLYTSDGLDLIEYKDPLLITPQAMVEPRPLMSIPPPLMTIVQHSLPLLSVTGKFTTFNCTKIVYS